jgi:hypothetical protein
MHDLTGTVVAIIDDAEEGRAAVAALAQQQFSAELLNGEDGRAHLNDEDETGLSAAAKKLALAFGDEMRIIDRLDKALQNGRSVVSVDVNDDEDAAARAAGILEEHGGHDMWRLGEWSFNRIGPEGSGEG